MEAQSMFISIINILGSVTSIAAFFLAIIKRDKLRNILLYIFISLLSISTAISFTSYKRATDIELNKTRRKQAAGAEAQNILDSCPTYISYYNPGENEGILYSVLILLENNRDIYPEMYDLYKNDVVERINRAKTDDISERRKQMEAAGKSAIQILKSLASTPN